MREDKELFLYPIFSSIISLAFLITFFILGFLGLIANKSGSFLTAFYVFIFVLYFGLGFINTFFRTATSFTAATRFGGGNATISSSMKFCFSRLGSIIQWSLLETTVGVILRALESIGKKRGIGRIIGRIVSSILGLAWKVLTVFVIPAIVYENAKAFEAIKLSVNTLKKTWGESLIKWVGVYVIKNTINFLLVILFLLPAIALLFIGSFRISLILIALWLLLTVLVTMVMNIADEVYDTALFAFSKYGSIPTGFNKEHFSNSFKQH